MIYDDFRRDAKSLDRQTDENVFQKLQGRYMKELEKQLHRAAEGLVEEHTGDRDIGTLQHELARQISYLLSEFLVKAKSM